MRSRYAEFGDEIRERIRPYYLHKDAQQKWTPHMYNLYLAIRKVIWERMRLEFKDFEGRSLDWEQHIRARELLDEIMPRKEERKNEIDRR